MRHWFIALGAFLCLPLGLAQATPRGLDVDVFFETIQLEQADYDNVLGPIENRKIERERRGARLAFGAEGNQTFFQVFNETADLTQDSRTEMFGIGVGSKGTLRLGSNPEQSMLVVPWRVDLSYADGEITDGPSHGSAYYLEAYGDIGIGIRTNYVQTTVGAASSAFYGYLRYDSVLSNEALDGTNGGTYLDVQYITPESPLYSQLRWTFGDYEALTFRIGLKF